MRDQNAAGNFRELVQLLEQLNEQLLAELGNPRAGDLNLPSDRGRPKSAMR